MRDRHLAALVLSVVAAWSCGEAWREARATSHRVCVEERGSGGRTRDGWDGEVECVRYEVRRGPDQREVIFMGALAGGAAVGALGALMLKTSDAAA